MSDAEKDLVKWLSPRHGNDVIGDVWTGSIDHPFAAPGVSQLGPEGLLYHLDHPDTGDVKGQPCAHRGKDMPHFFDYCPFCGVSLKGNSLQGVWLPPYGWAPFNGVPKSERYHPRALKNPPAAGLIIPGSGPLRFWILPLMGGDGSSPSYLFAYRPQTGQIYWLADFTAQELSPCNLVGEKEDIKALRGNPLGSARSWSVVWANDYLFLATASGLLRLQMLEEGTIQVKKLFDGKCLATPGLGLDGQIYFPGIDEGGMVGVAHMDPTDAEPSHEWCGWRESKQPSPELFKNVSAPVGMDGGDINWVARNGVLVLEGDEAHWVEAVKEFRLIPRAYPWLDRAEIRFCAQHNEGEFKYYAKAMLTSGSEHGNRITFPYPSSGDGQWFVDGYGAEYNKSEPANTDSPPQSWVVGSWEAEISERVSLHHILLAKFDSQVAPTRLFEGQGDVTVVGFSISNDKASDLLPDRLTGVVIAMPIDTLIVPISANLLMVYGGDQSPDTFLVDLKKSRFRRGGDV